ncbi:MAG TPA: hypothetical protein PLK24_06405 [Atribacter sp.]|jgi:hypothetical protein|uniref:Uncharacterized protein n=1 Tax=Candidatus Atribacter allofermentans TaxID=1852833 RepID=A0A1V5SIT8_9BACT|nr:hypothetical protein [Atribacter sp.]MDD3714890.1 hypothetical protein [Atribacterota bacterium]OQA54466.1 MAG: hypothetical protein BWY41_02065 [Candidatus Atribacteria bacterium ADurb.Bin276]HHT09852.1 hypothetical protein [Candidatus Atribacteria bacterium]MDI9594205.1 hypothetical protein [Atribacterota bacterium]HQK83559.1 hypothetical protein [Atribacter sp.]
MAWQIEKNSEKKICFICGFAIQPYVPCVCREEDEKVVECAHLSCFKKQHPEEFEQLQK